MRQPISSIKTKTLKIKSPAHDRLPLIMLIIRHIDEVKELHQQRTTTKMRRDAGGFGVGERLGVSGWGQLRLLRGLRFIFIYMYMYINICVYTIFVGTPEWRCTHTWRDGYTRTSNVTSTFNCCWRLSRNVIRAAAMRVHCLPALRLCE